MREATLRWLFVNRFPEADRWWCWASYLGYAITFPTARLTRDQRREAMVAFFEREVTADEAEILSGLLMRGGIDQRLFHLVGLLQAADVYARELERLLSSVWHSRRAGDVSILRLDLGRALLWAKLALAEDTLP